MGDWMLSRKKLFSSLLSTGALSLTAACRVGAGPRQAEDERTKAEEVLKQKATIQVMSYIPPAFV